MTQIKMSAVNWLSNDLYVFILDYLIETDQIQWCMSNKKWYDEVFRGNIRKLRISIAKWSKSVIRERLVKVSNVIKRPFDQLWIDCSSPNTSNVNNKLMLSLNRLLECVNDSVWKLKLEWNNPEEVDAFLRRKQGISVQDLTVNYSSATLRNDVWTEFYSVFTSLQTLTLDMNRNDYFIPFIPTLLHLNILSHPSLVNPLDIRYLVQLQKLVLFECKISDVSMLGRIPVLYLHFCQAITDISALNHNQRIQITLCDGIEDFTQSFEQAEDIVIRASSRVLPHVNFNHWKKVKKLMISCYNITLTSFDIPHTVIDCSFNGMIEANFQGLRNPDYRLRELQIINSSIISLEDLGLERLIVIELACLTQLASLEGIGFGRNQRISIRDCPLITDFSPLRYTYQVEIKTNQKVNLSVLDHVYSLKITAEELIFDSLPFHGNIYSLEISVKFFDLHDLKMIPFLIIPSTHIPIIEQYLELGGKLLNQRIDIIFLGREQQAETRHRIQPFFDRFLQSDFQFQEMVRKVASEFYASYYSWAFLRKQI